MNRVANPVYCTMLRISYVVQSEAFSFLKTPPAVLDDRGFFQNLSNDVAPYLVDTRCIVTILTIIVHWLHVPMRFPAKGHRIKK